MKVTLSLTLDQQGRLIRAEAWKKQYQKSTEKLRSEPGAMTDGSRKASYPPLMHATALRGFRLPSRILTSVSNLARLFRTYRFHRTAETHVTSSGDFTNVKRCV